MSVLDKALTLKQLHAQVRERRAERWLHDPVQWVADVLPTVDLADHQKQAIQSLVVGSGKTAARGPRGSGKTMPAALVALWFSSTRELAGIDWKAPVTAGSWLQLSTFTLPEIHKWVRHLNWQALGLSPWQRNKQLFTQRIKTAHGELFAINSDNPNLIEGAHADHMLLIVDEAKSVPDASWDAMEGYFSSPGEHYRFVISTPSSPAGRFYDIHSHRAGYEDWTAQHVTIEEAVRSGRVTQGWADQLAAQWGPDSQLYRCHVLAEFAGGEDGIIPLAWVEAAIERGRQINVGDCRPQILGVDVAVGGADLSVIAFRDGNDLYRLESWTTGDSLLAAERVQRFAVKGTRVIVDPIGVGDGTLRTLQRDPTLTVIPFVASAGTKRRDKSGLMRFVNKRAAAWWNLRELLDPANEHPISLPDLPELVGELTAPGWREVAGGKIQVESKDDIRRRIGRSTDYADAVVQAFWDENTAILQGLSGLDDLTRTSTWT